MKNNDFVILCLRLLSIYLGAMGLGSLPTTFSAFIGSGGTPLFIAISPFIFILCSVILYVKAPNISHFIVDFSTIEEENFKISTSEKTARIALLVLGVFIFVNALPQFVQISLDVGLYYKDINEIPKHLRLVEKRWTYLIGPLLKIILSIILIIGPDKVIGILSKYDDTFKRIKSSDKD